MKFSNERKQSIIIYLLEKISQNTPSVSKIVSDTFGVSTNTIHTYINELLESGVIDKSGRGQYKLVNTESVYNFKRSENTLSSEMVIYSICMESLVSQMPENVQHIWSYAFSEMVNNVIDHSEAENLQVVISHNSLHTSVSIIDDGVGIFEKIKKHFSLSTLDEAICELFKGKLTTDELHHSGEGIFFSSKMMDTFWISSGGKIFSASKYSPDAILDNENMPSGTCVYMRLSNYSHKTAREFFDMYSDDDGAFYKTRIPIKNLFDTPPVSRSQAKRLCNRLEKFGEVVLDFDGISWMGQGFAHELFVVYSKSHPQIKFSPINMNESVTNMYNHAVNTK